MTLKTLFVAKVFIPGGKSTSGCFYPSKTTSFRVIANNIREAGVYAERLGDRDGARVTYIHEIGPVYV
jgi:hypothetical protein